MSRQYAYVLLFVAFLFSAQQAQAEKQPIKLSASYWFSKGNTAWNHDASSLSSRVGNPTSALDYQNVDSQIIELGLSGELGGAQYWGITFGLGQIDSGTLVDDDYVSAAGAIYYGTSESGEHRYSRTQSDIVADGLNYLKVLLGLPIYERGNLVVRMAGEWSHWSETYMATGVRQIECTAPGTLCNSVGYVGYTDVPVITNTVNWQALGIVLEIDYHLNNKLTLQTAVTYLPLVDMHNEDVHHLRSDLRKDPSFSMSGDGEGLDLELGAEYRTNRQLAISLAYRKWVRRVSQGTWNSHPASGGTLTAVLNELRTEREGWVLGLNYKF